MLKQRVLEIVFWSFLASYLTAMGFIFSSSAPCQTTNCQRYQDRANERCKDKQWECLRHWITHDAAGFFTLWLVIVGGGQLGMFWKQLGYINKSLTAANIAANAAKEAAKIARESSEAAIAFERPYVRISGIKASIRGNVFLSRIRKDVFPKTDILQEPYAMCTIENYGKTPAFIDATQAQLRFSGDNLQIILTVGKPIPVVTLRTGQSYRFKVPLGEPINQQRAEDIQSGEQYFWLHFNFVYLDVLGKIHQTPDKWKYIVSLDSFSCVTGAYRETT
jgi:hypothetical protein